MSEAHDSPGPSADVLILCRRLFQFTAPEQMSFFVKRVVAEPEIQMILQGGDLYMISVVYHGVPYCLVLHLLSMRTGLQEVIDDHGVHCGGTRIDEGDVVQELTRYATARYLAKPAGLTSSTRTDPHPGSTIH
jgi:hypothetical protein